DDGHSNRVARKLEVAILQPPVTVLLDGEQLRLLIEKRQRRTSLLLRGIGFGHFLSPPGHQFFSHVEASHADARMSTGIGSWESERPTGPGKLRRTSVHRRPASIRDANQSLD